MSSRSWARIEIGGTLTPELKEQFDALVEQESLEDVVEEAGKAFCGEGESRYGRFDDLENFCTAHGLSWKRHAEGEGMDGCDVTWWAPGMEGEELASAAGGDVVIRVSTLEQILKEPDALGAIAALVRQMTPPLIPPLVVSGPAAVANG